MPGAESAAPGAADRRPPARAPVGDGAAAGAVDARRALAVGVAGLGVALIGQMALDRRTLFGPVPGWLLLSAGAVLAATGLVGAGGFPRRAAPAVAGALHGPGRRWAIAALGGALLVLGAVPGFVGLAQTDGHAAGGSLAWGLWLAGAVVFAGALGVGHGPGPAAEAPRPLWRRLWPWLLILAVAAGLRFYALDLVPRGLWADELIAGMQAEQIWDTGWRPLFIGGQNGEPALYLYPIALLIRLFGPTILPIRLPMALAGTAAVAAIGWLALPLYGRRAALAAAAILAAMTWEINFSRIGFNAIWSLPVDLLAAGCLVRALATGRVRWYAWAGLLLGLGFQLYYISRAWLGLMVLLLAYRLLTERGLWRRARGGLAILLAGLLIGAAPVLVYALVQPADYAARASTVAVTAAIQQAGNLSPLGSSILAHLGMWNLAGDPNGRHDLPGARMLDLITAALLPCGLAIALLLAWRQRHGRVPAWPYLFPAAGLFVLLAGGILSAPDESPQALRTLGDTSAVALLAALPVAGLWRALPRPVRPGMPAWGTVAVVAILTLIVGANARRYFLVQEVNPDVYKAFSTPARLAVEIVQQQPPTTDDFLAMGLYEQATVQYLAGHRIGTAFTSPHETPLPPGEPGHAALLLLDNRNTATLDWLRTLYPHATIRSIEGPAGGNALFFSVLIPAADRNAQYYVNLTLRDAAGVQVTRAVTDGVTLDWGALPLPGRHLAGHRDLARHAAAGSHRPLSPGGRGANQRRLAGDRRAGLRRRGQRRRPDRGALPLHADRARGRPRRADAIALGRAADRHRDRERDAGDHARRAARARSGRPRRHGELPQQPGPERAGGSRAGGADA